MSGLTFVRLKKNVDTDAVLTKTGYLPERLAQLDVEVEFADGSTWKVISVLGSLNAEIFEIVNPPPPAQEDEEQAPLPFPPVPKKTRKSKKDA